MNSESENSIYNYNMIFNKVNNVNSDEDIDLNTNIISDINLQNFDMKRYEYYTNLIYIYKKDPDTLYNLLNKYYNIKNFKKKEKNIIKYISNYARLLKGKTLQGDGVNDEDGKRKIEEALLKEKEDALYYGGAPSKYENIISKLKEKVVDDSIIDNSRKQKPPPAKTYEMLNLSEQSSVSEDLNILLYKGKLEKILKMLNKTLQDITKQEELIDKESTTNTTNALNKTVKFTMDIVNKLLAYINNDDNSVNTKKLLNKTVMPSIDFINKLVGSMKKEDGTKTANILNKTVKPAIKLVNKLLADINARVSTSNNSRQTPQVQGINASIVFGPANAQASGLLPITQPVRQLVTLPITQPVTQQLNGPFGGPSIKQPVTQQLNGPFGGPSIKQPVTQQLNGPFGGPSIKQPVTQQLNGPFGGPPITQKLPKMRRIDPKLQKRVEIFDAIQAVQRTGPTNLMRRTVGGKSNEDLKIQYLDTQKYKKLGDDDLQELRLLNGLHTEDDNNKIGQLSNDIDNYYDKEDKEDKDDRDIIQKINNFENDPKNPLEELELTFDDRIVFIIATFFIRYITIIMVQWCIDINIIKTFYEGFIYYAVIYITIFWFIVLFVNIDNSFDVKYMNFNGIINSIRTLFYYFYMGTNGISRLLIHTSLIMILIIIPIILNIKKKEEYNDDEQIENIKILNYDERKQLSKSLSLFTMFIWLFTSIIATKF